MALLQFLRGVFGMYNFCNCLLAGNYVVPIVASVTALVLLVVLMIFVAVNVRKKKNRTNNSRVIAADGGQTAENPQTAETSETVNTEEISQEADAEAFKPQTAVENNVDGEAAAEVTIADADDAEADDDGEDEEDSPEDLASEEEYEVAPQKSAKRIDGKIRYIIIKYNKSFTAKLIQSDDNVKNYYSVLKNELLSYSGVKARMSWKGESFYCGRKTYAKLCIRGKCVCLFLALNAKDYAETKYKVDDMSEVAAYERIPCLYRIKNERRLKYSSDLIASVMEGRAKTEDFTVTDYAKQYPYEDIEPLIDRGLVKVLTEEDAQSGDVFKPKDAVTVSEADELMQDEIAVALIEEADDISDKTKTDIVNIDTLSKNFVDGETVTLEEIKKRVEGFSKKATAVKVLARGRLDKKLTVIADSYSIQAAKMILLTGGNAVKKKNS